MNVCLDGVGACFYGFLDGKHGVFWVEGFVAAVGDDLGGWFRGVVVGMVVGWGFLEGEGGWGFSVVVEDLFCCHVAQGGCSVLVDGEMWCKLIR